jgi:Zn-dependent protease with chaperone function
MPRARWRWWRLLAIVALIVGARPVVADLETEIEEGLGNWMAQAFIAQRGRLDQPPIEEWVQGVGRRLTAHCSRADLDYQFVVLDSPEANGYALPGGWIFVTAGLLETMDSEDELAAVIAHELGHLANRDFQRVVLRTALWLGLAEVLRNNERDDWVPVVQGAQLVETLHHSRRREGQADAAGTEIAWQAGYDPRAMAAFLGDEPKWSYLETVFSTHPHPTRRSDWLNRRFAELRAEDPHGALALARSLLDRGRCAPAAEVLAEPFAGGRESERVELLARVRSRAQDRPQRDGAALPADRAREVSGAVDEAVQARSGSEKQRKLAWKRLRRLWDDQQVERGLVVAQAVDPELNDPGYLLLVAQAVNALHRAMRGGNLVARTLHMWAANASSMEVLGDRIGAAEVPASEVEHLARVGEQVRLSAEAAVGSQQETTRELARLAGEYHEIARLVAPLLVELALAGAGDPAGRLTFARFMLIEARVRLLDDRLGHRDDALEQIAGEAWRRNVDLLRLRLNVLALEAGAGERREILATLARRVGAEAPAQAPELVGDWALETLRGKMRPSGDSFGDDLRATQILIRIGFIEVKGQVAWCAKEKSASEGAGSLAIRSAVRHPQ